LFPSKPKGSGGRLVLSGLVGPKLRPKGVGDGQQVDIPVPPRNRLNDGETQEDMECAPMDVCAQAVRELNRKIRSTISSCDGERNVESKFLIAHCLETHQIT